MEINTFVVEEVKGLEVNTSYADVYFDRALDDEIRVEAENISEGTYTCGLRGEHLVVSYKVADPVVVHRGKTDTRITLYLPKEFVPDTVKTDTGAGNIYMNRFPVSCKAMEVRIGAGNYTAENLSVEQKLYVNVGAGNAKLYFANTKMLKIDCGVGRCNYDGKVNGDIDVDCGVGKCKLRLDNKESDFNYDISCGIGKVNINNKKTKLVGNQKRSMGGNVLGTVTLRCGVGKISLETDIS